MIIPHIWVIEISNLLGGHWQRPTLMNQAYNNNKELYYTIITDHRSTN